MSCGTEVRPYLLCLQNMPRVVPARHPHILFYQQFIHFLYILCFDQLYHDINDKNSTLFFFIVKMLAHAQMCLLNSRLDGKWTAEMVGDRDDICRGQAAVRILQHSNASYQKRKKSV